MPFLPTKGSARPGSISTVIASFLHFDTCFTIWVLLGSLSVFIEPELKLNAAQQGLMVALPTLSGSLIRLPVGLLSDRYSGKSIGIGLLTFLFLPLLLGWLLPVSFPEVLCIGLMLGVAGSSFAVALPLASRWYPPTQQGLVMGIAAAGYWAAGAAFTGSTLRPLGGYIADRLGGVRVLSILLLLIAGTYVLASLLLPIGFTGALFIVGIAFMGMGNGAVFQLVPQRFQNTIGVATGLVGALGGIGGFVLPFLLGSIKQTSGSYAAGWIILAIFAFVVLAVLRLLAALRASWRSSWAAEVEGTEIYPQASRA